MHEQTSHEYLREHGIQIGRVVVSVGLLDNDISDLLTDCLRLNPLQSNALLRPMTTRAKADLTVRLGKLFLKGGDLKPITKWCESVKAALDERNSLIHGAPGHKDGKVHFRSFTGKNKMIGVPEPWPAERVSQLADDFSRLADDLRELAPTFEPFIESWANAEAHFGIERAYSKKPKNQP